MCVYVSRKEVCAQLMSHHHLCNYDLHVSFQLNSVSHSEEVAADIVHLISKQQK